LQQDGKQFFAVTVLAIDRLALLAKQMAPLLKKDFESPLVFLSIGLSFSPVCIPSNWFGNFYFLKPVIDHNNKIINLTCLISYISLIYFNFPLHGWMGLAGLFLAGLKGNNQLPASLDFMLRPLEGAILLHRGVSSDMLLIIKLERLLEGIATLSASLYQVLRLEKSWPQGAHPFHGFHQKKENEFKEKIRSLNEMKKISTFLGEGYRFNVNKTYIYSDFLETLLPDSNRAQKDYSMLFAQLREKMQEHMTFLDAKEALGFKKIEEKVITGRSDDPMVVDLEKLRETIGYYISSLLDEKVDFDTKIRAFAQLGVTCDQGWARETKFLLHPQSKDPYWSVHHVLAVERSELVKAAVLNALQGSEIGDWSGGKNNLHLLTDLQIAMYGDCRTYDAEVCRQQFYSLFSNLCFRYFHTTEFYFSVSPGETYILSSLKIAWNRILKLISFIHLSTLLTEIPGLLTAEKYWKIKEQILRNSLFFHKQTLENQIYEAIRPEKQITEEGKTIFQRRIAWEAIVNWLASLQNRHPEIGLDEPCNPYIKYLSGQPILSKKGVRLMLWDMGILEGQ